MAKSILGVEKGGKISNSYAIVNINREQQKTQVIDSVNPEWNVNYEFRVDKIIENQVKIIIKKSEKSKPVFFHTY